MSSSFSITLVSAPSIEAVVSQLGDDIRCRETPVGDLRGEWPVGVLHFYRQGLSTRTVEVVRAGDEFQLRILSLSSPVDYELAFRFVELLGGNGEARLEGSDPFPAAEATTRFRDEWMTRDLATAVTAIITAVRAGDAGAHAAMPGAVREVFIGQRFLSQVSDTNGDVDPARLLEAVRSIQFLKGFEEVGHLPAWGIAGPNSAVAIWDPGASSLFAEVTHLGVALGDTNTYLPVAVLPDVAGDRFRWLDDGQFVIEAVPESELASVLQRAREHGVSAGGPKKWWQFWK